MTTFQQYQAEFTAHLRQPAHHAKPHKTNAKRMAIYREIVFNNFHASVAACFPVLHSILGKRKFRQLVRMCFHTQTFHSPLFHDIPASFVDFLQTPAPVVAWLPPYSAQLAHYEWMELDLGRQVTEESPQSLAVVIAEPSQLAQYPVRLPQACRLLKYDYPVHQLSRKRPQAITQTTFLLMTRNRDFDIRFTQINALTHHLLQSIQTTPALSAYAHLKHLASSYPHMSTETVIHFGLETLFALYQQQVISI